MPRLARVERGRRCTRLDYCQFLVSSQINYTMTHLAAHTAAFSHDAVTRYLAGDRVTPRHLWERVQAELVPSSDGYLIFDDTVLDKNDSRQIALVRRQWSGTEHDVIRGIGVVTCVYVNPDLDRFWVIDYRIYAPPGPVGDGKSKLDHVAEMLAAALDPTHPACKALPVRAVLMDAWYATRVLLRQIEALGHVYYCPLKPNRLVDAQWAATGARRIYTYTPISALAWSAAEGVGGKDVHLKDFPKGHRVRLFRLVLSSERTDYVATNDGTQDSATAVRDVYGWRWKIEQLHREAKQVTGIARCQARRARSQRNHIGCALLVWARLTQIAQATHRTIYAVKFGQLTDYLRRELAQPSVPMDFA
ncbi:MAG: IS701 family transposase [Gemmatirosa sp.]